MQGISLISGYKFNKLNPSITVNVLSNEFLDCMGRLSHKMRDVLEVILRLKEVLLICLSISLDILLKMLNQEEIHQQILKQQLHFAWHMNNPVTKKYLRLDEFIDTIM